MSGLKGPTVKIDLGLGPKVDTGPSLKDMFENGLWNKPLPFEGTALLKTEYQGRYYMPPRFPSKDMLAGTQSKEEYTKAAQMEYYRRERLALLERERLAYYALEPSPSPSPTCDLGGGLTISLGFRVISASIQGPLPGYWQAANAGLPRAPTRGL